MARIDIKSNGATLNDGVLQLENGVAMDSTLRNVADQNNTTSPLKLSTTAVQVVSPLRITTDDPSDMYLDCEDGSANNRFNITRNTASQQVNLNFASNPVGSTTTVGAIRTFTDGVNLGEVVKFREDGQVTFTERVNVEADSLVTTESCSVIAASTTNANLVIAPNGTGALVASIPDGTATGGNARGNNAVDLQTVRTLSSQVANGSNTSIAGGSNNQITSSSNSFIGGGFENTISTSQSTSYSTISGGYQNKILAGTNNTISGGSGNQASNNGAVVMGGLNNNSSAQYSATVGRDNTASSNYSTISGGQSNTASTGTHATVVGGFSNTASGQYSVAGGASSIASNTRSFAFGGTASGEYSCTIGFACTSSGQISSSFGRSTQATGQYSFSLGNESLSYLQSSQSLSGGKFSAAGDAQQSLLTARRESTLTSAATTVLSLDGTGVTDLIIPSGNNRVWNVVASWTAVVTQITGTATGVSVGDVATECNLFAFKKIAGVSSIVGTVTNVASHNDASMATAAMGYTAGASQELIPTFSAPIFVGGGSLTIRVVLKLMLTEVAY